MNEGSPSLEVGFAIDTGGSFSELERLRAIMNSTEGTTLKAAAAIEGRVNGLNFGGATAQVTAFGNAATRELQTVARETANAEKAAERMIAQLERENATFGKTRSEIRQMNAEMRASKADSLGLTEVAGRLRGVSAEADRLVAGSLRPLGATGQLAGHHMQNLAFQFQDLGVQMFAAAGSSHPLKLALTALVQQGSQIGGIMSQAGIGIRGVGAAFLTMSRTILLATVTNPYLLAFAAAATAAALAVRAMTNAANKAVDIKAYASSIGVSADEMRKLDNVTVTFGDTTKAVFQVAGRAIWGEIGPSVNATWDVMKDWIDWIGSGVKTGANFLIGGMVGAYNAVRLTWAQLPAAFGDSFYSAVNNAIDAINSLVRASVDGINGFIDSANDKLGKVGVSIGRLGAPEIAGLKNQFAGAAKEVAGVAQAEFDKASGVDYVGRFGARVGGAIIRQAAQNARDRVRAAADDKGYLDPEKSKKHQLTDEEKAYKAALKAAQDYIDAQAKETARIGLTAKEIRLLEDAAQRAKAPTDALKQAIDRTAAAREAAYTKQADKDFEKNVIQPLRDEIALYGLVGPARAQAALALEHDAFVAKQVAAGVGDAEAAWRQYYDAKSKLIDKDAAADAEVERVKRLQDEMDALVGAANDAADAMARAFGRVGGAIGDATVLLAEYGKRKKALDDAKGLAPEKRAAELSRLQLDTTTRLIGATKSLFSEKSKAYAAFEAAEKALAVAQLARTAIDVAGGAAKMFASLGPFAFPAVAAMLAVMASLGFGGGGSAGSYTPKNNDGTGTVLGDTDAKSESLAHAIDALKDVDTVTSVYARQMAATLKSIDSQIGGLATVLVRSGNLGADALVDTGFKSNATSTLASIGGIIGGPLGAGVGALLTKVPIVGDILKSLFGTKTKVLASGIYGSDQSLSSILSGGYDAQTYSDVEKKKKLFGLTTSTKYSTVLGGALDGGVTDQFALILRSFNDAIVAAAGPLGDSTDAIVSRLSGFVFSLGKIDLTDLSGTEIQEKLSAVFGAAADDMAAAAFPGITRFQKVGEGAFETLVRVSSTVEAVTDTLDQFGAGMRALSIDAKVALAGQFDSIGDFSTAAQGYFEAYYTKAEQATARTAQLAKVFGSLGLAMPTTLEAFRALVEAQDLTTASGQTAYATLLKLAPVYSDLQGMLGAADSAADAAESLREAWKSVGEGIADEVKRIRGLLGTDTSAGFATLQGRFNAASDAARAGDQEMAKALPGLSQALLSAAEKAATSRQELDRIRAQTADSLDTTYSSVVGRSTSTDPTSIAEILDRVAVTQAAATQTAATGVVEELRAMNDNLAGELDQLRQDTIAGFAAVAGNTGKTARVLENVSGGSGGNALQMNVAV